MAAPRKPVNLLPESEFEASFWGRFLKWAVSGGRYIIILTELVVILAFLSRFKLDRDISALSEEINGKVNVLEAQSQVEKKFREKQQKVLAAATILESRQQAGLTLDKLIERIPVEVKLSGLEMNKERIKVEANALGELSLGQWLSGLNLDPTFTGVDLNQITEEPLKGIKFVLNIHL